MDNILYYWWRKLRRPAGSAREDTSTGEQGNVVFLFLRRMRFPLLVLIGVYAVAIGGLVLIPGVDGEGNPWHFDFFHAFYFISYTGSTIGFGEVPYAFTPAQRMWTTFSIYLTVIGWLYAIGKLLILIQDPAFQRVFDEQRFARQVQRLKQSFYLVCGYGETGRLLVTAFSRRGIQTVVIDADSERASTVDLDEYVFDIPALCGDARDVGQLLRGGLLHPYCLGVIATTNNDAANVKAALTAKLLSPRLQVASRAQEPEAIANLHSFAADYVINPYDTFGEHLAMTLHAPSVHMLYEYLIPVPGQPLPPPLTPPQGMWIVCGFGHFGKAVNRHLQGAGVETVIIESDPRHAPPAALIGCATDPAMLDRAGLEKAVGIIAGTPDDAGNLSITIAARARNPRLFLIARQNRRHNQRLFDTVRPDLVMQPARIIVWGLLAELTNPLLSRFLHLARRQGEPWAKPVLERIATVSQGLTPATWTVHITAEAAPAVHAALTEECRLSLGAIAREPHDRQQPLSCLPLLLVREGQEVLLPDPQMPLRAGDSWLLAGQAGIAQRLEWVLGSHSVLEYIEQGTEHPDGLVWRWLARRHGLLQNR